MLLRKGVYPYKPEKGKFYSNLNLEDIAYVDYAHAEGVYKDFEIWGISRCVSQE